MKMSPIVLLPVVMLASACSSISEESVDMDARSAIGNVLDDLDRQRAAGVDVRPYRFSCGPLGSIVVSYRMPEGESSYKAIVTTDEGQYHLPRVISASGVRYSDGNMEWWENGEEGMFSLDANRSEPCELVEIVE